MTDNTVASFPRRAQLAGHRRASLAALGMIAITRPQAAEARNRNQNDGQKAIKFKRCKKQPDHCRAYFPELCAALPFDPAECVALFTPCCSVFADCSAAAALECIFDAAASTTP